MNCLGGHRVITHAVRRLRLLAQLVVLARQVWHVGWHSRHWGVLDFSVDVALFFFVLLYLLQLDLQLLFILTYRQVVFVRLFFDLLDDALFSSTRRLLELDLQATAVFLDLVCDGWSKFELLGRR